MDQADGKVTLVRKKCNCIQGNICVHIFINTITLMSVKVKRMSYALSTHNLKEHKCDTKHTPKKINLMQFIVSWCAVVTAAIHPLSLYAHHLVLLSQMRRYFHVGYRRVNYTYKVPWELPRPCVDAFRHAQSLHHNIRCPEKNISYILVTHTSLKRKNVLNIFNK